MGTTHHRHGDDCHHQPNHKHEHHHGFYHTGHSHGHGHGRGAATAKEARQLKIVIALTLSFMIVEVIGGYYTNSLALVSDAAHMLTDAAALALSLFAFFMSSQPATDERTYGFLRFEILAAFINGIFLVLISIAILWGAWDRYLHPVDVKAAEMFWISLAGLLFNLFGAWTLLKGDHHNLNVRGALFHVLGDALGSFGAIVAAALIYFNGWTQADPIVSAVIALIIIASAFRLLLDTTHVILEGTPQHLDAEEIRQAISSTQLVKEVHDLHVWSITSGMVSLSVHVVAAPGSRHDLLCRLRDMLKDKFHIEHVTIQIEDESLKSLEPKI
jgi:cobalt-zinc-cadmium efflux system protein